MSRGSRRTASKRMQRLGEMVAGGIVAVWVAVAALLLAPVLGIASVFIGAGRVWRRVRHAVSFSRYRGRVAIALTWFGLWFVLETAQSLGRRRLGLRSRRLRRWARYAVSRVFRLPPPVYDVVRERGVVIPIADGIDSRAHIYHPVGAPDGSCACVLIRTPYDKANVSWIAMVFAERGYVVVAQDTRGRAATGGDFFPIEHEKRDGEATLAWIESQPWFNGSIGTYGVSYIGLAGLCCAAADRPSLKAVVPVLSSSHLYPILFPGHAPAMELIIRWSYLVLGVNDYPWWRKLYRGFIRPEPRYDDALMRLPVSECDRLVSGDGGPLQFIQDGLRSTREDDPFWESKNELVNFAKLENLPNIAIFAGLYDFFCTEQIRDFHSARRAHLSRLLSQSKANIGMDGFVGAASSSLPTDGDEDLFDAQDARDTQRIEISNALAKHVRMTIGPFTHWSVTDFSSMCLRESLAFFHEHLDTPNTDAPHHASGHRDHFLLVEDHPIRVFVLGVRRWRLLRSWPPAGTSPFSLYLAHGGQLGTLDETRAWRDGDPAALTFDRYTYDPSDPTPAAGGPRFAPLDCGPEDQGPLEAREDVLVYTSDLLEQPIEVIGEPTVVLWVSSSSRHTDFVVRLCDVDPDGVSINIAEANIRLPESASKVVVPVEEDDATAATHGGGVGAPEVSFSWKLKFALSATAVCFQRGHRIRLHVCSGAHPRIMRNLGTGEPLISATHWQMQHQTVFHAAHKRSHIVLPIIPTVDVS